MASSEQEILSGLAEIVNEETGLPVESVEPGKSFTDSPSNVTAARNTQPKPI